MGKDSAARIELGRSFHQMGTVNEKVCESDFVPLWDGTVMHRLLAERKLLEGSAGRYTGSYRIPVFIFLMIWIFKIPPYRCHLNKVRNATLLERGLFSLLHFGEDTAVCVTKRESSETEALVSRMWWERRTNIHNIHIDRHKYPPSAASAPASLTHNSSPSIRRIPVNCRVPAFLNSLFIILRP